MLPDERIRAYAEAAAAHGRATAEGDSARANEAHDRLAAIYRRLRDSGQRDRLLPLLHHANPAVRCWAGAHALEFAPKEGESILRAVATEEPGIVGFDAAQTLEVWREGELRFP